MPLKQHLSKKEYSEYVKTGKLPSHIIETSQGFVYNSKKGESPRQRSNKIKADKIEAELNQVKRELDKPMSPAFANSYKQKKRKLEAQLKKLKGTK